MGGGEGGATLVCALETEMGVDAFPVAGGGAARRRGGAFGAAFLPATAELISVDISAVSPVGRCCLAITLYCSDSVPFGAE